MQLKLVNVTKHTVSSSASFSSKSMARSLSQARLAAASKRTFKSLRAVPPHIPRPSYANGSSPPSVVTAPLAVYDLDSKELQGLRQACTLARRSLDYACSLAVAGVSTEEMDAKTHEYICAAGGYPSPLNYGGFPKSICTSVNNTIVHGIPHKSTVLKNGDVISVDVSVFFKGYHGDNCCALVVGDNAALPTSDGHLLKARKLVDFSKKVLDACISIVKPNERISKIGAVVQEMCDAEGYGTNKTFCGHGIGKDIHMQPLTMNFKNDASQLMLPGMCFTIEPIIVTDRYAEGTSVEGVGVISPVKGALAAQNEHVVLVTRDGHEILTVP